MKRNWKRIVWITLAAAVVAILLYHAFLKFVPGLFQVFQSRNDEAAIESFLKGRSRVEGLFSLAILQMIQVVSVFFPGAPIQIAGGLIYGTLRSFLICHLSFVGTNVAVFQVVRFRETRLGRREEKVNPKRQKVIDWINSSDPVFMSVLAYMMPGIPNGFVPYAASRTDITFKQFGCAVYLGSILQILIMCSIGSRLMTGDYLVSILLFLLMVGLIFALYRGRERIIRFLQQYLEKRKGQSH